MISGTDNRMCSTQIKGKSNPWSILEDYKVNQRKKCSHKDLLLQGRPGKECCIDDISDSEGKN
jgi:hypothetical protein